jgi:hemolysin activation/secretion protein
MRFQTFHHQKWIWLGLALLLAVNTSEVLSQEALQLQPGSRRGEGRPPLDEPKPLEAPPAFDLPAPPPIKEKEVDTLPLVRVFVRDINVDGSTVFTPEELDLLTAPYENRWITSEDLEKLRQELTLHYINNGYITSGAVIPDQDVAGGIITYKIIEGRVDNINIENNRWLLDHYIENRVARGVSMPVNIEPLQKRLQLLQQDTRIETLNAELKPGLNLGESDLDIDVKERTPIRLWTAYDNYLSRNTGPEQKRLNATNMSLTGNGDILNLTYGESDGLDPLVDVSYAIPITRYDTMLSFRYRKNNYDLLSDFFEDLNIETDTDIYTLALQQPIFRNLNHNFTVALVGEKSKSETELLNEKFSLERGAQDGEVKVTALRLDKTYTYRTQRQVIAARSRLSFGLDALDSTSNDNSDLPDDDFFVWLGQFQWAYRFNPSDIQLLFRADAQLTQDPLFSLEQIAVGGRYTVRGYNENQFVRDKAVTLSLESRLPLVQDKLFADYLQIVPFFDYGWADTENLAIPGPDEIYSVGVGLRWAVTLPPPLRLRPMVEVYYGKKLNQVEGEDSNNLQDKGIHFQIALSAF